MSNDLNIFDAYGHIRELTDADVEAVLALTVEHQTILKECMDAVKASEAGEARVVAARADVRAKDQIYNDALEADHKANPPSSHQSALAAVIAANAGRKPEPPVKYNKKTRELEPVKVNKKTKAALAEAEMVLAEARSELTRATTEHRALVATAGEKLNAWRLCLTTPSDFEVRRQYQASSIAERARRVEAGLSAEAPKIQPAHQSELDRVFAARGKVANRLPAFMGKR